MNINIKADKNNESRMVLIFNEDKTSEIFEALKEATKNLERVLYQHGLITDLGVSPAEMVEYLEAKRPDIDKMEEAIVSLTTALNEVKEHDLNCGQFIQNMLQEKIEEACNMVNNYYDMFKPFMKAEEVLDEANETNKKYREKMFQLIEDDVEVNRETLINTLSFIIHDENETDARRLKAKELLAKAGYVLRSAE